MELVKTILEVIEVCVSSILCGILLFIALVMGLISLGFAKIAEGCCWIITTITDWLNNTICNDDDQEIEVVPSEIDSIVEQ